VGSLLLFLFFLKEAMLRRPTPRRRPVNSQYGPRLSVYETFFNNVHNWMRDNGIPPQTIHKAIQQLEQDLGVFSIKDYLERIEREQNRPNTPLISDVFEQLMQMLREMYRAPPGARASIMATGFAMRPDGSEYGANDYSPGFKFCAEHHAKKSKKSKKSKKPGYYPRPNFTAMPMPDPVSYPVVGGGNYDMRYY
jgi:hypothetical protein